MLPKFVVTPIIINVQTIVSLLIDDTHSTLERHQFVKEKWYQLGLKLGILKTTLDEIKAKHNNDPSECLTDMLSCWESDGECRQATLALALKDMGFTAAVIANYIVLYFCHHRLEKKESHS